MTEAATKLPENPRSEFTNYAQECMSRAGRPKPAFCYVTPTDELPAMYSTDGEGDEALARVKLFTPDSSWMWYLTEYDPETETAFGLVKGLETELGYVSLRELADAAGPLGLRVERDLHWKPRTLAECRGGGAR